MRNPLYWGEKTDWMDQLQNIPKAWYHGTTSAFVSTFDRVLASKSRPWRDFGNGFYLTEDRDRAIYWAKRKTATANANTDIALMPMLITCKIQINQLIADYQFQDFGTNFTQAYLNYLVYNRIDNGRTHIYPPFDAVFGLVADGAKLDATLLSYRTNMIQFKQAKQEIEYKEHQTQLCIKNQSILDSSLFKVTSRELIKN